MKYIVEIADSDAENIERMKELTDDLYITDGGYEERLFTHILEISPYPG